jgi:hypothetical protein
MGVVMRRATVRFSRYEEELTDADIASLTDGADPGMRVYGRLLATRIGRSLEEFVNAEDRAGTPPADVRMAVLSLAASVLGSIIVQREDETAEAAFDDTVGAFHTLLAAGIDHCRGGSAKIGGSS